MANLTGKVILITGASRGIGAQIAQQAAQAGARVIINYARGHDEAQAIVQTIEQAGGQAIAIQADVSQASQVTDLFTTAIAHFGCVDVLVNNAGIMITKPLKDTTDDDFTRQFDINVRGTFNTLREAATQLADGGSIINFSSTTTRPTPALRK